jgi:hypothetical protein
MNSRIMQVPLSELDEQTRLKFLGLLDAEEYRKHIETLRSGEDEKLLAMVKEGNLTREELVGGGWALPSVAELDDIRNGKRYPIIRPQNPYAGADTLTERLVDGLLVNHSVSANPRVLAEYLSELSGSYIIRHIKE